MGFDWQVPVSVMPKALLLRRDLRGFLWLETTRTNSTPKPQSSGMRLLSPPGLMGRGWKERFQSKADELS